MVSANNTPCAGRSGATPRGFDDGPHGHYDVCLKCLQVIEATIAHMKRHKGQAPTEELADSAADKTLGALRRAICVACGDPADFAFKGRPYCAGCLAEKEGAPPCANCGDPNCGGDCGGGAHE